MAKAAQHDFDSSSLFTERNGRDALIEAYQELAETASYLSPKEQQELQRCAEYGAWAHEGQNRQSGEPYFTHPIQVCRILAVQRFDMPILQGALLHDVLEDTAVTTPEMAEAFGDEVTALVDGVSKLERLKDQGAKEVQAESFKKMFVATTNDPRVIIIKLADRLHNMQTLGALRPDKRIRKAKETLNIYASIAGRLGLFYFRIQLEDLAFSHLYPWRYAVLKKNYLERYSRNDVVDQVRSDLKPLLKKIGIKASISKRQRHLWGLYQRMLRKNNSFKQACQTIPIRVITDSEDSCYRVLGQLHSVYRPVTKKFEDFIAAPKSNGYRSLHISVLMANNDMLNVQIRSKDMHALAETGIIAIWHQHMKNRSIVEESHNVQAEQYMRDWLFRLKDVQNITHDPMEFYDAITKELSQSDIYAYSPKGKIYDLPRGATPVDFAYAVHTKLGDECIAAEVNGKPWPLFKPLKPAQTVKIIRQEGSKPQAGWLRFVATAKARAAIRYHIRHLAEQEAYALGERLLDIALRRLGSSIEQLPDSTLEAYAQSQQTDRETLLSDIGHDRRQPVLIASALMGEQLNTDNQQQILKVESALDSAIHFDDCCYPLPHEPILGHFKPGLGIKIHRRDCVQAQNSDLNDWVRVAWAEETKGLFAAGLSILLEDRPRMLAAITAVMGDLGSNIIDFHIEMADHDKNKRLIKCFIEVRDRDHLAVIIKQLRLLNGITTIKRL
ncbi:RelA/SpoT family protein [Suttonella sp. R2A3]|uniref:RelA/SpoT family protein n=1 Tax=Suttonella sp. R2A3 TaxID=2908648 RepID=UPI001F2D301F|nr:RelA/SpoT family protein [Suttonella sp. R2A3]UJF24315.1 RelA/SpoT family protein [Suttonella sp. R2A3]